MKFVLPVDIKDVECDLPFELFNENGLLIRLEEFTLNEKEWFFDIKNLKINKEKFSYALVTHHFYNINEYRELVLSNYKVTISKDTSNPAILRFTEEDLDFVFRVVIGKGLPTFKVIRDVDMPDIGMLTTRGGLLNVSRRNKDEFTIDDIEKTIRLIREVILLEDKDKKEILHFFIKTAMKQGNINRGSRKELGIAGSFYIAALDSLFLDGKDKKFKGKILADRMLNKKNDDNINKGIKGVRYLFYLLNSSS